MTRPVIRKPATAIAFRNLPRPVRGAGSRSPGAATTRPPCPAAPKGAVRRASAASSGGEPRPRSPRGAGPAAAGYLMLCDVAPDDPPTLCAAAAPGAMPVPPHRRPGPLAAPLPRRGRFGPSEHAPRVNVRQPPGRHRESDAWHDSRPRRAGVRRERSGLSNSESAPSDPLHMIAVASTDLRQHGRASADRPPGCGRAERADERVRGRSRSTRHPKQRNNTGHAWRGP